MEIDLSIQQVAELTGLSIDTLRYYERIGLIEPVQRAASGHRRYKQADLEWIGLLINLRATGMPISQMIDFAKLHHQGPLTAIERLHLLEQHQHALAQQMQKLQQHGTQLQQKIARKKAVLAQQGITAHTPDQSEAKQEETDPENINEEQRSRFMQRNEQRVALVTGASSGIGEATALALAAQGIRVAVAARRTERLESLVARIQQAGGEALALSLDVTDEQQVQTMVRHLQERWGRLDILVNSAGLMLLGPIAGADTEDWRRMISTNVLGLLYATHAALPLMQAQGGGHIVNISSLAGRIARAGSGVYNATKWGVGALSEALRQECVHDHIRVTVIEPGIVETDLASHITNSAARENALRRKQNITPLQSNDIANAIVYAVMQPLHVNVNEILLVPSEQGG
ncbi:SDR family NAD(P)-dependent oxidoreductase [Dictyobacter alpinus]|nr:SDR family NAD(P)-dependent oxidoreductase [Dictyobacter alpinus]